ncbi:MAG: ABC transporter ATP-binding protein [Planctomycetota bacterium]
MLQIDGLRVVFDTADGRTEAVRGISLEIKRGQTLALVGESGSGKSVTSYAILRLIQKPGRITSGRILFRNSPDTEPIDLAALPEHDERLFDVRGGKISMIFQEPMTALSPVHTIGNQICESILLHVTPDKKRAEQLAVEIMAKVGIPDPETRLKQYPFEFSGGMRQRVVIAMALVSRPSIVIADEPTTALDVTVQAQILRLINELQDELGTSVLFITHDLGVVAQVADEVAVMQKGLIVERAGVEQMFRNPLHPYTRRLLAAVPHEGYEQRRRELLSPPKLPEEFPTDRGFDPPPGTSTDGPSMHRLPDGRDLLLWPTTTTKEVIRA